MKSGNDLHLGDRIRQFRKDAGLTQAKLAETAGVSPAYVSELEGGSAKRPSGQVLLQLAKTLGVTIADLIDDAPTGPPRSAIEESLAEFARERRLPKADVEMLASIRFRGQPPRSARRWGMIYDSIQASSSFDD